MPELTKEQFKRFIEFADIYLDQNQRVFTCSFLRAKSVEYKLSEGKTLEEWEKLRR